MIIVKYAILHKLNRIIKQNKFRHISEFSGFKENVENTSKQKESKEKEKYTYMNNAINQLVTFCKICKIINNNRISPTE